MLFEACAVISVMEHGSAVRFETVEENAKLNGWDERGGFAEFRACLVGWLTGSPLHLEAKGAPLRVMCEMLLDPEEGPLMGGYGYEHSSCSRPFV